MLYEKLIKIIFATSAYCFQGRLVIGDKNDIPWRGLVPSDMERFRSLTMYKPVIMGRKTWDSIPEKFRPLEFRQNIIITKNPKIVSSGIAEHHLSNSHQVVVTDSFEEAVLLAGLKTIWVIGGAEIYKLALPYADYIYQTMVDKRVKGDTFFPDFDWARDWEKIHTNFFNPGEEKTPRDKVRLWHSIYRRKTT